MVLMTEKFERVGGPTMERIQRIEQRIAYEERTRNLRVFWRIVCVAGLLGIILGVALCRVIP